MLLTTTPCAGNEAPALQWVLKGGASWWHTCMGADFSTRRTTPCMPPGEALAAELRQQHRQQGLQVVPQQVVGHASACAAQMAEQA